MIGDRRILIATLQAGVGNLLNRRRAVAPFGVHLQVAAVLLKCRARECRLGEDAPDLSAAEKVAPKLSSPFNVCTAIALFDRVFDGRRLAGLQNLADDPC